MKIKKAIIFISDAKAWASHSGIVFSSHYELEKLLILDPHKPTYKIGLLLWNQIFKGPETVIRKYNILGKLPPMYVWFLSFFLLYSIYFLLYPQDLSKYMSYSRWACMEWKRMNGAGFW